MARHAEDVSIGARQGEDQELRVSITTTPEEEDNPRRWCKGDSLRDSGEEIVSFTQSLKILDFSWTE